MKAKKKVIAFIVLVIVLLIAISFAVVSNLGNKSKEVKVAKEFVASLQKKGIIDIKLNLGEIEFKSMSKLVNSSSKTQYTVIAENIGVDLDGKYGVTGFFQKSKVDNIKDSIDENTAREISERYINEITNEKFTFKEIREVKENEGNSNIYTIAFYKYFKNYPYYDNEIVVNINKSSGKLESYTNQSIDDINHNLNKSIDLDRAKKNAVDYFTRLNQKPEIVEEPLLALILGVDGEFELSYVVNVKTTSANNKEDKYKLFINAESGEVVNRTADLIESSTSN